MNELESLLEDYIKIRNEYTAKLNKVKEESDYMFYLGKLSILSLIISDLEEILGKKGTEDAIDAFSANMAFIFIKSFKEMDKEMEVEE